MPILFLAQVYKPWVDFRDSSYRVATIDDSSEGHREFILNPFFITDVTSHTKGSTFLYSDNIGDRRESPSRIICNKTVAQLKTIADSTAHSNAITLPIHIHNNPEKDTVDTTIPWATIAYAVRYNPDPEHHVWVVYDRGSFKRVEVLCNLALEDVEDKVRGAGTTSTTFSTVEDFFD